MASLSAEVRRYGGAQADGPGRNPGRAALRAEMESVAEPRTKAESIGLMEAVCERGNLWSAYERVVRNKGAAGVDGLDRDVRGGDQGDSGADHLLVLLVAV